MNLAIADLADGDGDRGGDYLRLAVRQSGDDSSLNNASTDNLAVGDLRCGVV